MISFLICATQIFASPPETKPGEKEQKAIKELVAQVIKAIGNQDIDTIVSVSNYPWSHDPQNFSEDKDELRRRLRSGFDKKPVFDAKPEIKSIHTLKEADLGQMATKGYRQVMTEDDFVVHVEVDNTQRTLQVRLLIKIVDGKPRLVGVGQETR